MPAEVTDIKTFLEIARRKDAKCVCSLLFFNPLFAGVYTFMNASEYTDKPHVALFL